MTWRPTWATVAAARMTVAAGGRVRRPVTRPRWAAGAIRPRAIEPGCASNHVRRSGQTFSLIEGLSGGSAILDYRYVCFRVSRGAGGAKE